MSDIKKQLGQRIRSIRKARSLTQEQLAEYVDIGTPNISYIENGKFAPSVESLQKIARALGVEPYELYKFDTLKEPDDMKKELYNALDNDEKLLKIIYEIYRSIRFNIKNC